MVEWKSAEKEAQVNVTAIRVSESIDADPGSAPQQLAQDNQDEVPGASKAPAASEAQAVTAPFVASIQTPNAEPITAPSVASIQTPKAEPITAQSSTASLELSTPGQKSEARTSASQNSRTEQDDNPPDLGDRYEVLELIGSGGMGTVWKVHDRILDELFAIKVLRPEFLADDTANKRFQREARLASELTHTNIAAIFGPGFDAKDRPYIIMRYVDGESLADILAREGKLSEERAIDIFTQVCEAMAHSHMKGIVHRDIKPSNIVISKTESGADLVQLVDFGIASCVYEERTKTQALTKAVDVFGSPRYMSPEQLLGEEVTQQSDIYSLGCVFYEMLTGKPPFTEENPVKLILQQMSEPVDLNAVPFKLRYLVYGCLAKETQNRHSTFDELIKLVQSIESEPQSDPDQADLLPGSMAAVMIVISMFSPIPGVPTIGITAVSWSVCLMLNSGNAIRKTSYRKLELCFAVVTTLTLPLVALSGTNLPYLIFPILAGLAAWLTTNEIVLNNYLKLTTSLELKRHRQKQNLCRFKDLAKRFVTIISLPVIMSVGFIAAITLLESMVKFSIGTPLVEIIATPIDFLTPLTFSRH
jgi:serine/threonine protein kinase